MKGELVHRKMHVGEIGFIKLFIKKIEIKQSSHPKVAIVANLHGDETSSLFVISRLLKELRKVRIKNGEINFFVFSNPAAFLLRERTWKDRTDLNRIFPGKPNENLTSEIALKLSEELKKMDVVIDLHNMDSLSAILGLFMAKGNKQTRNKSLELLLNFSPDIIWKIKEVKYANALGPFLSELGIPNFAVEMSPAGFLTQEEIVRVENGIKKVLSRLDIIEGNKERKENSKKVPIVVRKKIISQASGLFTPLVQPLQKIRKNQKLGKISHNLMSWVAVKSPSNGIIMRISTRRFVDSGDELASIGEIERWLNGN
jgi:predicted deacylase